MIWEQELFNLWKDLNSAKWDAALHSDVDQINMLKKVVAELESQNEEMKDKVCELQIRLWQSGIEY